MIGPAVPTVILAELVTVTVTTVIGPMVTVAPLASALPGELKLTLSIRTLLSKIWLLRLVRNPEEKMIVRELMVLELPIVNVPV